MSKSHSVGATAPTPPASVAWHVEQAERMAQQGTWEAAARALSCLTVYIQARDNTVPGGVWPEFDSRYRAVLLRLGQLPADHTVPETVATPEEFAAVLAANRDSGNRTFICGWSVDHQEDGAEIWRLKASAMPHTGEFGRGTFGRFHVALSAEEIRVPKARNQLAGARTRLAAVRRLVGLARRIVTLGEAAGWTWSDRASGEDQFTEVLAKAERAVQEAGSKIRGSDPDAIPAAAALFDAVDAAADSAAGSAAQVAGGPSGSPAE